MKKKLLISAVLALVLVCLFAIAVGATTYVYSDEDGNPLYSATAEFEGAKKYELIKTESGSLAKTDANGNSLTWYVVADDNGTDVRNITVKSIKTADAGVITDGKFTFTGDVTADNVVSVNFFGMDIKRFDTALFMTTAITPPSGNNPQYNEYCQVANGKYLLFLYLPKTLEEIPDQFCYRTSIRVLEWEDNTVLYTQFPNKAFQFCANLKKLVIPEGITTLKATKTSAGDDQDFRNCMSLSYVKFPSTMTELTNNVFFRCTQFETIIFGENMTKIGYLNKEYIYVRDVNKITTFPLKYIHVPGNLILTGGNAFQMFDSQRGQDINSENYKGFVDFRSSVVFFVHGDANYVKSVQQVSDKNFRQRVGAIISYEEYIADKNKYDNFPINNSQTHHVIVYNTPDCVSSYENHTMGDVVESIAPTCTTVGVTTYICAACSMEYSVEIAIDKDAHVFDDENDISCNNCGFVKEIECTEHNYSETVTAPDCTNGGYTTYTCTVCGESYVGNNVDALGHSYDKVVTEPTCTSKGYTTNTCSACGDTYVDSEVDMLEHSYVATNTYKDALTSFVVGEVCSVCGDKGEATEYAPLLTYKGFSAQIGGERVTVGYSVDKKTQAYLENLSYGLVIAIPGEGDDISAFNPVNPDFTVNGTATAVVREVSKKYDSFNLFVDGFNESNYAKTAVICAFVTDGKKVEYLYSNASNEISQQAYATPITFADIAEACTPRYQITFACDETMGTLEGETSQTVYDGQSTSTVKAVAKEGYTFACWSDGTQTPEITVTAEKKATLTASFVPNSTGLPVITINTENGAAINSLENYVNCEITLFDNSGKGDSVGSAVAEIKGRGNSTWEKFDKKPYKFKFDKKQDLFGYGKEKTWVLLADARDYSLLRNMLALNAGLSMSELGYTSKGQSVELYLNGEYRGVYYLCEQIQVKDNRVNITAEDKGVDKDGDGMIDPDSIGYLVEMDAWAADGANQNLPNYTKDGDVFVTISGGQKPYVIKDPEDVFFDENGEFDADKAKPYLDYIKGYLQECHNAINADATVEGNYEKLCELIDVKSFAQAYIIFDLFKNPDVNYSSVYYYKDVNGKLVAAPLWDFDMAVGNVTHKESNTGWQIFSNTERLWTAERNDWMRELLEFEEFRTLVYEELVANEKGIKDSIAYDLAYARAHKEAYEKNFTKWNLIGNVNASQASGNWSVPEQFRKYATWEEHLAYIENYLNESYAYLLTYYAPEKAE
ncbi:MAG: CotH kinase family protein [Clostridia bacterium]|nr:CotH kinase family protein [Clostridia bacterium]